MVVLPLQFSNISGKYVCTYIHVHPKCQYVTTTASPNLCQSLLAQKKKKKVWLFLPLGTEVEKGTVQSAPFTRFQSHCVLEKKP